jgi:DNA-binding CsgD family transcriptional regulator
VIGLTGKDWARIDDFLVSLSPQRTTAGFFSRLLELLPSLIPFEGSACLIEMGAGLPAIRGSVQTDPRWVRSFNEYFCRIATPPDCGADTFSANLKDLKRINFDEYVNDFLAPQDIGSSAGFFLLADAACDAGYTIVCNRLRSEPKFGERELETLRAAERHLKNAFDLLCVIENLSKLPVLRVELGKFSRVLSERECEVVALLLKRQRPAQIACELRISPLTVKKHIGNIYEKLDVTDRRQLFQKLSAGSGPP